MATVDLQNVPSHQTRKLYGHAIGTVTIAGASGSIDSIEVDGVEIMSGAENFDTDLATTATAIAANITANTSAPDYNAAAVGAVITITAVLGGTAANDKTVVTVGTTMTATDVDMSGGAGASDKNSFISRVPSYISVSGVGGSDLVTVNGRLHVDDVWHVLGTVDGTPTLNIFTIDPPMNFVQVVHTTGVDPFEAYDQHT